MKEWFKKYAVLLVLLLNLTGSIMLPFIRNISTPDKIVNTLNRIEFILNKPGLALITLELEMVGVRTPIEVDQKVLGWEIPQLAALKCVFSNEIDREKLRDRVFSEEVYKALEAHSL